MRSVAPENVILAVVGNKIDLIDDPNENKLNEVPYDSAKAYAKGLGAIFKLVSAKDKRGIVELFKELTHEYFHVEGKKNSPSEIKLKSSSIKRRRCCV